MQRSFILFILFILTLNFGLGGFENQPLQAQDVKKVMDSILSQHVSQHALSGTIIRHSFKQFIEQADPDKIYLTAEEVRPFLNMSDAEVSEILREYEASRFDSYRKLNEIIQKAMKRAENERKKRDFAAKAQGSFEAEASFAETLNELKLRQQKHYAAFSSFEKRRLGKDVQENLLLNLYNEKMQNHENEYVTDPNKQGSLFYMHLLKSLTKSLDAHSSYLSETEAYDMRIRLEKSFEGIGIQLERVNNSVAVAKIMPDSPAMRSGRLQAGDKLLKINGRDVSNLPIEEVMREVRGKKGSKVDLLVSSKTGSIKSVALTREEIPVNEGRAELKEIPFQNGVIGVIKLASFYQSDLGISAEKDIKEAIAKLQSEGRPIKGLILDLRENSGGFLSQSVKVAGLFITNGVIVVSKYSNGEERFYRDMDGKISYDGPLIVLTSKMTASAAEIVAQALQDYGVGVIVGDKHTFGKGTIQSQTVTDNQGQGAYFKVTVGKYYTVSGKTPQEFGVKADIVVPSPLSREVFGEEFLEDRFENDAIKASYADTLQDIDPGLKPWYLRYYMPTLQKRSMWWHDLLPELKRKSEARIANSSTYRNYLGKGSMSGDLPSTATPLEVSDQQLNEAVNVAKDMAIMESRLHQNAGAN